MAGDPEPRLHVALAYRLTRKRILRQHLRLLDIAVGYVNAASGGGQSAFVHGLDTAEDDDTRRASILLGPYFSTVELYVASLS